jgi:hypothetical protein
MNRLPFILSSIAVAVLAGCATESGITSAPAPAVVAPAPAAAAPAPAAATPTYSVGAAGTTIVVPQASPAATAAPSPAATPLRVGFGRIESIMVVPSSAAAAGGTAPNPSKRIAMRMDNGTVQYFDTHAEGLTVGDRIEITTNGTMRHPA